MAIHAAMITRMDREVGRVVEQLRAMNQLDNTVVLFLSDNGASAEQIIRGDGHDSSAAPGSARSYLCLGPGWASAANTPFRLHKSYVHEGGIASPLIVHWPAGIRETRAPSGMTHVTLSMCFLQLWGLPEGIRPRRRPMAHPRCRDGILLVPLQKAEQSHVIICTSTTRIIALFVLAIGNS